MEHQIAKSNLQRLLNQTVFLLEQHQESKSQCIKQFDSLLSLIKNEIKERQAAGQKDNVEKLECVLEIVHQQLDQFEQEVSDDIAFLEDQCMYINNILSKNDSLEAERMYVELMGEEELLSDDEFKKEVLEEAQSSQKSFSAVIDDLRAVIEEGDIDELMAYLEAVATNANETESDESDENDEEEDFEDECCMDDTCSSEISKKECCKGAYDCKEACVCSSSCGCSKTQH